MGENQYTKDKRPWTDEDTLRRLYRNEGLSTHEIADVLNCSQATVFNWMEKYDIERETPNKEKVPSLTHHTNGYETFQSQGGDGNDSVLHHRLLAVSIWGFEQLAGKVVHHKSNIPWDNRPSNLQLVTQSEHMDIHYGRDDV